mgnify:FL=1
MFLRKDMQYNKVKDIYELCHHISPFDTQESWDKSGLNLGSMNDTFEHILVCLEVNLNIAQALQPKTLLITHHPLFFQPLNAFCTDRYPANIAQILLQKHCCVISLHTNFDKSHLNTYLTHKVLQWEHFVAQGLFMYGSIAPISLPNLAQYVCKSLQTDYMQYIQGDVESIKEHSISDVYIVCGSGCSLLSCIPPSPSTCFITSDVKHHDAMIAKSMGISLIDMGHYESEKYFVEIFDSILQNTGYNVIIADCENPFSLCLNKSRD